MQVIKSRYSTSWNPNKPSKVQYSTGTSVIFTVQYKSPLNPAGANMSNTTGIADPNFS